MTLAQLENKYENLEWPRKDTDAWRRTSPDAFDWSSLDRESQRADYSFVPQTEAGAIDIHAAGKKWALAMDRNPEAMVHLGNPAEDEHIDSILQHFSSALQERDLVSSALHPDGFVHIRLSGEKRVSINLNADTLVFRPFIVLESLSHSRVTVDMTISGEGFFHPLFILTAGDDSAVSVSFHQGVSGNSLLRGHTLISTGRNSSVTFLEVHTGGKTVKTDTVLLLEGEGGEAELKGLSLAGEGSHVDISLYQEHIAAHAQSHTHYRSITGKGGYSVFQGLIQVDPAARGTNAYLENKNLLLDKGARADSLPRLRIDTNDVKCSHGSTTGRINGDQVHYLMTRGFPRHEARNLLVRGFAEPVLSSATPSVVEKVEAILEAWRGDA